MRGRWVASSVALLALIVLAPGAQAGDPINDCTTVNVAVTQGVGASMTVCPDDRPSADPNLSVDPVEDAVEDALEELPPAPEPTPPGAPEPPETDAGNCEGESVGANVSVDGKRSFVCLSGDGHVPYPSRPSPDGPETEACGEDSDGEILVVAGMRAGACVVVLFQAPENPQRGGLEIDTESCQLGGDEGEDPRVEIGDGALVVCVVPVLEGQPDPELPPIDVSTEPCSSRSVDPSVTIGDAGVWLCIEYQIDP